MWSLRVLDAIVKEKQRGVSTLKCTEAGIGRSRRGKKWVKSICISYFRGLSTFQARYSDTCILERNSTHLPIHTLVWMISLSWASAASQHLCLVWVGQHLWSGVPWRLLLPGAPLAFVPQEGSWSTFLAISHYCFSILPSALTWRTASGSIL